jgi:pyridinium-3,5-biscarboxylic acid mononucleotide sulfurtransferase
MTDSKTVKLDSILRDARSLVIAFSGGVDSSFLAWHAARIPGIKTVAVTIRTPYMPSREIREAVDFAALHKITHEIIDMPFPEIIRHNPVERCYFCKKTLFARIVTYAKDNGFRFIADGTNADDIKAHRPGLKALNELEILSPLAGAGFTKKDIRERLLSEGLDLWDKPGMACLMTRIPYDTEVSESMLRMIEDAEEFMLINGYPGTRVRVHNDMVRIECMPGYLEKIVKDPHREMIIDTLKKIGFRYISLDLEGYRTGSMDK